MHGPELNSIFRGFLAPLKLLAFKTLNKKLQIPTPTKVDFHQQHESCEKHRKAHTVVFPHLRSNSCTVNKNRLLLPFLSNELIPPHVHKCNKKDSPRPHSKKIICGRERRGILDGQLN